MNNVITDCPVGQALSNICNKKIESEHWREFQASAIADAIIDLNFQTLEDQEPYDYLIYSQNISRRNDGRLRDADLMRYRHTQDGGWWCNGVDPLNDYEPMMWGCFKPNSPRSDPGGKLIKYEHPFKEPTRAFFLQVDIDTWKAIAAKHGIELSTWDLLGSFWHWVWEKNLPIVITEGVKKAASLLSHGYVAIGLPGVNGAVRTPKNQHGERIGNSYLIPDIQHFATLGREITVCFDHDTKLATIRNVRKAISSLGWLLRKEGCKITVVQWDYLEKGVDDLIANHGQQILDEVYDQALPLDQWQVIDYSKLSYEPNLIYNKRYISTIPAPEGEKLVCVKSPKGTGKSHALIPIVRDAQQRGIPVLLLTHRIQLGKALAHNLGLPFLGDLGQSEVGDLLGFGLCVDSLHPLSRARFNADNWKNAIVIVDESEQVIWHTLNANTEIKKHRSEVLNQLSKLLHNALNSQDGKVILLDADLTDVSIDTVLDISEMTGRINPWVLLNRYQEQDTKWNINHFVEANPAAWLSALISAISGGEKSFICLQAQKTKSKFSTKNLETLIHNKFPDLRILRIDSESIADPNHHAFGCMEHLNELVPQYDVLLCSPCVETGISIDVRGHFTSVWGCFQGVSPENSARQSLARVRESIPRNIWVAPRGLGSVGNGEISLQGLVRSQQKQFKLNLQGLSLSGLTAAGDIETNLAELNSWAKMACRINATMPVYRESVLKGLIQEGHIVVEMSPNLTSDCEELQTVREENYHAEREEIISADVTGLDEKSARKLHDKKAKTKSERLQDRKYTLQHRYGVELTPELVEKDDKGFFPRLRMHYFLTVGREYLPSHDQRQAKSSIENQVAWLPDFNHSQLSKKIQALELLGIRQFLENCDREIHNEDPQVIAIVNKAMGWRSQVKELLGLKLSPERSNTQSLGQILDLLDLSLECTRKVRDGKQRTRFYRLNLCDGRKEIFAYWLSRDLENQMSHPENQMSHPNHKATSERSTSGMGGTPDSNINIYMNQMSQISKNPQSEIVAANAEILTTCETREQLIALTESWEPEFKKQVWSILSESDRKRIAELKAAEEEPIYRDEQAIQSAFIKLQSSVRTQTLDWSAREIPTDLLAKAYEKLDPLDQAAFRIWEDAQSDRNEED